MSNNKATLYIESGNTSFDTSAIKVLCEKYFALHQAYTGESIVIDFRHCNFLNVTQIAAMAVIAKYHASRFIDVRMYDEVSIRSYLSRMDFYSFLNIEIDERFNRHDTANKFLPITHIPIDDQSINNIGCMISDVVKENCVFTESASGMLDYAFGEIIDNIVQHSVSAIGGIAICQYYKSNNYLEVCIADAGIGIHGSLKKNINYAAMDDAQLVEHAFSKNTGQYIGTEYKGDNKFSGGIGLFTVKNVVMKMGGKMFVISKNIALDFLNGTFTRVDNVYFPGTLISIKIPKSNIMFSSNDIFRDGEHAIISWNSTDGKYELSADDLLW